MPSLNKLGVVLLFWPHLQNKYFAIGAYTRLLQESEIPYVYVSEYPDIKGLVCAADLVETQFS